VVDFKGDVEAKLLGVTDGFTDTCPVCEMRHYQFGDEMASIFRAAGVPEDLIQGAIEESKDMCTWTGKPASITLEEKRKSDRERQRRQRQRRKR